MKIVYFCNHCNSENVWANGMKHMNDPDTFAEHDSHYCAGECDGEISSVGIRDASDLTSDK